MLCSVGAFCLVWLTEPREGVELAFFAPELEVEHGLVAVFGVGVDAADGLAGGDAVAGFDVDFAEVAVDGEVAAVADDDVVVVAWQDEDARDGALEDGPGVGAFRGADVDAVVRGADVGPALVAVATEALDDFVAAVEGEGQAAAVGGEVVGELALLLRDGGFWASADALGRAAMYVAEASPSMRRSRAAACCCWRASSRVRSALRPSN